MINKKSIFIGVIFLSLVILFVIISGNRYLSMGPILTAPTVTPLPTLTLQLKENGDTAQNEYVKIATDDLSGKLNISSQEIQVEKVEAVEWSDTSLGCPQRGMFYAQVITPGYKIELSYQGKSHIYHAGSNRVVTCPR